MKNSKYKILVLSDMKDTTTNTIKNGVSLAKMVGGEMHFFHVKKPTDVVDQESQLSAIRTINRSYLETGNKIQNLIEPMAKDFSMAISYSHAFGNVKSEITDYIKTNKPDVIVIGKRKSKPFNFIGDNITEFVIKNHDGAIMIASAENALEPNRELSLGVLNRTTTSFSTEFSNSVLSHSQKPLKSFNLKQKNSDVVNTDKDIIELVFDNGENSIQSLSNYLTKSDVNLLCVNRSDKTKTDIKNVISNVNVSLLISEDN
ncbi:MAG: nucleotide-binding universal stress UspA family protein [Glaciecola sp.]|jgi:nucleotide-binding universal stress UspA family protein